MLRDNLKIHGCGILQIKTVHEKDQMTTTPRFTSADLEAFPDDGKRYEIIDGELYVSKQPHLYHQRICSRIQSKLQQWSDQSGEGEAVIAPGLIFADDDDVAPDVVWISSSRIAVTLGVDGKLHGAPELIAEVLSPGAANEKRDREAKLKLYSRRGVDEYWVIDWRQRHAEVFRRESARLVLTATLGESDILTTPLLPGFTCRVAELFAGIPVNRAISQP
jgi:Uma2 family endonuclease